MKVYKSQDLLECLFLCLAYIVLASRITILDYNSFLHNENKFLIPKTIVIRFYDICEP